MDTATPIRRGKQFTSQQQQSKVSLQTMTPPNSSSKIAHQNENNNNKNPLHKRKFKKLPMIVDISVDINGNQVYQVHETKKLVRKEMPKSDFNSAIVTPQKNIGLHQISSNSLNRKRTRTFENNDEVDHAMANKARKFENSFKQTATRTNSVHNEKENVDTNQDEVIWSADVEEAFLEALRIIPKNGLTKIKISGRTCGRNELISDFIMTKTGKQRTRKQVSSHIQVIKNMKKNKELIDLIKNGPSEPSAFKKFGEIFGKINFQKSIGATGAIAEISSTSSTTATLSSTSTPATPTSVLQQKKLRRAKSFPAAPLPQQQQQQQQPSKPKPELNFKIFNDDIQNIDFQFYMTDFQFKYVNSQEPSKSHIFAGAKTNDFTEAPLKIRENANLTKRFPDLYHLVEGKEELPILHGMCNLTLPNYKTNDMSSGVYDASSEIVLANLKPSDVKLSCLTVVYSFGKRIVQMFESVDFKNSKIDNNSNNRQISADLQMGPQFWKSFNKMLKNYHDQNYQHNDEVEEDPECDDTIEIDDLKDEEISNKQKHAIRGLTIKQIIVSSDNKYHSKTSIDELNKNDIRSILLWEFNKVDTQAENSISIRPLYLPYYSKSQQQQQQKPQQELDQDQLPTPKTASFATFNHESEEPLSSASPFSPHHQYPLIPPPPIHQHHNHHHHHQTTHQNFHSSLPNLFQSDSDFINTTNQFRSLSSSDIARHLLSPQNSEHDDIEENGLMLQALNPDELYCDDPQLSQNNEHSLSHSNTQQHHLLTTTLGKDDISNLFKSEEFFW